MNNDFLEQIKQKFLTLLKQTPEIDQTREDLTPQTREVLSTKPTMDSLSCPYCQSTNFTRRGFRQKTHERVQLYLCNQCLIYTLFYNPKLYLPKQRSPHWQ